MICKMMDDAHAPEIRSGHPNVMKTYREARYRLSDLLRAQRNSRMTSNSNRWIEKEAPYKGDLNEDKVILYNEKGFVMLEQRRFVAC